MADLSRTQHCISADGRQQLIGIQEGGQQLSTTAKIPSMPRWKWMPSWRPQSTSRRVSSAPGRSQTGPAAKPGGCPTLRRYRCRGTARPLRAGPLSNSTPSSSSNVNRRIMLAIAAPSTVTIRASWPRNQSAELLPTVPGIGSCASGDDDAVGARVSQRSLLRRRTFSVLELADAIPVDAIDGRLFRVLPASPAPASAGPCLVIALRYGSQNVRKGTDQASSQLTMMR